MEAPNLEGLVPALIVMGVLIVATVWGVGELVGWLFIDDTIRSNLKFSSQISF
jgi:hypothetical protein